MSSTPIDGVDFTLVGTSFLRVLILVISGESLRSRGLYWFQYITSQPFSDSLNHSNTYKAGSLRKIIENIFQHCFDMRSSYLPYRDLTVLAWVSVGEMDQAKWGFTPRKVLVTQGLISLFFSYSLFFREKKEWLKLDFSVSSQCMLCRNIICILQDLNLRPTT